jgi:indole-3-glycerol phosphate synthase
MNRLDGLVDAARRQAASRKAENPPRELRSRLGTRGATRSLAEAISVPGLSVIAEFKRGSPSAGAIRADADPARIVEAYRRGGAVALSVLTEEEHFLGSLDDLRAARRVSPLPILRKDFIVDPYQLLEAVVAGADAVLLIAAALDDQALRALAEQAEALDLECLVEVHDGEELERALAAGASLLGINNRNLRDLSVDLQTTRELAPRVPAGVTLVAESGFSAREEFAELEDLGVAAVLVGESLMRAEDPEDALRALTVADRAASKPRI